MAANENTPGAIQSKRTGGWYVPKGQGQGRQKKEKLDSVKSLGVGSTVSWTSQSGSYSKTKTGKIVAVVPAGEFVNRIAKGLGDKYKPSSTAGFGFRRDHDTFLVAVPSKSGKGRETLYWPRMQHLQASDADAKPKQEDEFAKKHDAVKKKQE